MAGKDKEQGPGKPGPDEEQRVREIAEGIEVPRPSWIDVDDLVSDEELVRFGRFMRRIHRWALRQDKDELAIRFAHLAYSFQQWKRFEKDLCEEYAVSHARIKLERKKGGESRRHPHREDVRVKWNEWQREPSLYQGSRDFKAKMELAYPVNGAVIGNWMTEWRKERGPSRS